jgi:hypothetical protein
MFERVHTGAKLVLDGGERDGPTDAPIALILWSDGPDQPPLVAELSFRLDDKGEDFTRTLAASARVGFERLQRLPLARADGTTKTEYVYGDRRGD